MKTFTPSEFGAQQAIQDGAWQSWVFGPSLLDEAGKAKTDFITWDYIRESHPRTAIGWPITPEAMEWGPRFLHERYGLPIFITENGLSCTDRIHLDGKVHDPERIDFTHRYLLALRQGIEAGADVQGYFHWSLLDNFEWSEGYNERFGLVYVDYPTGTRTPKDSAAWYRETIDANGGNL